jgi:hypothetical protein
MLIWNLVYLFVEIGSLTCRGSGNDHVYSDLNDNEINFNNVLRNKRKTCIS